MTGSITESNNKLILQMFQIAMSREFYNPSVTKRGISISFVTSFWSFH